jgi:AbrB family looped-hinge helix DNA binding protein
MQEATSSLKRSVRSARFLLWLEQGFHPCYGKDMAKVTSKLQLTVPKAIADRYGIRPGDQLDWIPTGDTIRVVRSRPEKGQGRSIAERLALFDRATERQRQREASPDTAEITAEPGWKPHEIARGWRREDLYTRGRSR